MPPIANPLRRFTDACLRATGRRWPDDVADDMVREWQAELAHLRQQPGTGLRQLAFAASLVCSPAAESPVGWRGRLPPASRVTTLILLYVTVAAIAVDLQVLILPHLAFPVGADVIDASAVTVLMAVTGWPNHRRATPERPGGRPSPVARFATIGDIDPPIEPIKCFPRREPPRRRCASSMAGPRPEGSARWVSAPCTAGGTSWSASSAPAVSARSGRPGTRRCCATSR